MRFTVSFAALAAFACGSMKSADPSHPAAVAIRSDIVTANGSELNGSELNGSELNGNTLGSTLAAVHLSGAELNGESVIRLWLEGGQLRGQQDPASPILGGTELVGLALDGDKSDGGQVKLRIQSASFAGPGAWRYDFVYQQQDGTWSYVCAQGPGVIVSGRWNYDQGVPGGGAFIPDSSVFTIGCPSSAVEKCVVLGYEPWATFGFISGVALHTSCVRAIRADYCGDGQSHTTNGRLINIYDGVGVQADTESWIIEAEWTPDGARCVSPVARDALGITCSTVPAALSCGDTSHFQTGTRLMTETPSGPIPYPL